MIDPRKQAQINVFNDYLSTLDAPTSWGPEDYICIMEHCRQPVWPYDPDKEKCEAHTRKIVQGLEEDLYTTMAELMRYREAMNS